MTVARILCSISAATDVTIGLQQTMYTVTEDISAVFVCVDVVSGSIAGRTITIDYQTMDDGAEGMSRANCYHPGLIHIFSLAPNDYSYIYHPVEVLT